jgi:hypothetical protein
VLELHHPPLLVAVTRAGAVLPALLLASRGSRRYVQLSRGPGANHLLWVDAYDLSPGTVLTGSQVVVPTAR